MNDEIYINGIKTKQINSIDLTVDDIRDEAFKYMETKTISIGTRFPMRKFSCAIMGVSNNYLKMHGLPLIRKWE